MRKGTRNYSSVIPGSADLPAGQFTTLEGEEYYRISHIDRMYPFLMNIPSDTDLWMFIASNGGLTAGRVDPDGSLFPYLTADRIYLSNCHTGPVTVISAGGPEGKNVLWEPFISRGAEISDIERNLYKNLPGNRLIFEEVNHELGLTFRYRWSACDEFGHVRTATLDNRSNGSVNLKLLDGLRNVLPFGVPLALYQQSSSLVDAYKRTDLGEESGMAIFSLTSRIIDRAEAAEELRANVAWCAGLKDYSVHLQIEALELFRKGQELPEAATLTGRPGNYLVSSEFLLEPGGRARWHIAADAGRSHLQVSRLKSILTGEGNLEGRIEEALLNARENLVRIVGSADGIQLTGCREASVHHFANVTFNNMRGGIFASNYDIPMADFIDFVRTRNRPVAENHREFLESLPDSVSLEFLTGKIKDTSDPDLIRLNYEYLPLYFGRRHGDPSRPWNQFSIRVKGPDGERALDYQGNWRDIFQNWEGLALSFPGFIPNIIAKFVNASTVDGFNPYRITREGIDWEVVDPDDPWSYIGYWGDHQIIYLLKFLESLNRYYPGRLEEMLEEEVFSFADVPYRIKDYRDILRDPRSTIDYDEELASRVKSRARSKGSDGRLYHDDSGEVYHVNLLEKLLIPVLSKLSNLIPGAGIWMNTQRPEWNDANNALVGNGVSVVTLCYLRRHLAFISDLLGGMPDGGAAVSKEVAEWFRGIMSVLTEASGEIEKGKGFDDAERRNIMDALGEVFSEYRGKVYDSGFTGKEDLSFSDILSFLEDALLHVESSIRANRREDGLFHSYNLLAISNEPEEASIEHLYEMLEGQVAVLSSGLVGAEGAVEIMENLFRSGMYAEDRKSFLLYPERELPGFLEKNIIPEEEAEEVPLVRRLLLEGDRSIVARDADGNIRFNSNFAGARDLSGALDRLADNRDWREDVSRDRGRVMDVFEKVFRHKSFTGRSGTMYGYEGIGSIYWHMVAKLLLAVQEITLRAAGEGSRDRTVRKLTELYYRVRSGLGFEKSVAEYGAFPSDPYSHTPRHAGAQQPGMTGQVKEEIITRFGELGVEVRDGCVSFDPVILEGKEILEEDRKFDYYDLSGSRRSIQLGRGCLAFTFCQVPVVYILGKSDPWIRIDREDGTASEEAGNSLDRRRSEELFSRSMNISRITAGIRRAKLVNPRG